LKDKIDKNNSLTKLTQTWKKNQGMVSLSFDELQKEVKDKELIIQEKIDGELTGMHFDGTTAKFSSKDGRIRWDMPVLDEIVSILKKNKIKDAIIFGELAKTSSRGQPVHFNDTMSAIRKPEGDEEDHIEFFVFELSKVDGKEVSKTFEDYKKSFKQLKDWFGSSKHIFPVETMIGKVSDLKLAWKKYVEKQKNEGIVVRTSDNRIYKSKPKFTFDLGVIAIEEGAGKNKGRMGALILGFYDGDDFLKVVNLGVGFSYTDRADWWKLAKKHEVERNGRIVWVDPFKLNKVIETSYERLNYRILDTYKFKKRKWEKAEGKFAATISKPGFVQERKDKDVNKNDLRLSQIPDLEEMKKNFKKSTSLFSFSEKIISSFVK
jgi:ATP-dependent DNA ligase